ncbi:hypothetical protein ACOCEA_08005 [Maribacter sp. CXY002]|uniref:hypothetical protein n=1 Tax=Maribacter luteocoastalis TaxID=3407671 RepID=UPI003B67317D
MKKNTNKNPFITPKGYFDTFEANLMDTLSKEESSIPTNEGFSVPDAYFDTFQLKLNKRLKQDNKVITLVPYKRYLAIAAAVAALLVFAIGQQINSIDDVGFMDLANSEIEAYFDSNDLGMSSYELVEVLPVDQLEINDILDIHINNENIEDYLHENIDYLEELNVD